EDARKKPPAEAIPMLMELYSARDGSPALRGAAAAGLAFFLAQAGQPYEAMEWAERFAKEKVDPGHETSGIVSTVAKSYPGLQERWDQVASAIEEARKAAQVPKDPVPVPGPAPGGKVG